MQHHHWRHHHSRVATSQEGDGGKGASTCDYPTLSPRDAPPSVQIDEHLSFKHDGEAKYGKQSCVSDTDTINNRLSGQQNETLLSYSSTTTVNQFSSKPADNTQLHKFIMVVSQLEKSDHCEIFPISLSQPCEIQQSQDYSQNNPVSNREHQPKLDNKNCRHPSLPANCELTFIDLDQETNNCATTMTHDENLSHPEDIRCPETPSSCEEYEGSEKSVTTFFQSADCDDTKTNDDTKAIRTCSHANKRSRYSPRQSNLATKCAAQATKQQHVRQSSSNKLTRRCKVVSPTCRSNSADLSDIGVDDNTQFSDPEQLQTVSNESNNEQNENELNNFGSSGINVQRGTPVETIQKFRQQPKLTDAQLEHLHTLIRVIREGSFEELVELLEQRAFKSNLLNVFVNGQTALHYSLMHGRSLAWCKQLIENGANPNLANRAGWHPIHLAAFSGSRETMRYLIDCVSN